MRKFYDEMNETISWEVSTSAAPEYPGLETFDTAVEIPGRKDQQIIQLAEDRISDVSFTLPPRFEPHVGDRLDGATVMVVETVKDVRGRVLRWVARAKA